MRNVMSFVCMAGLALASLLGNRAQAQYEDLVKYVPETANTLVLVDAKALFASPIAQRENWGADRAKRFTAGLTGIPPHAERIVIACEMDIEQMHPTWEVAIAKMDSDVSVSSLASQFGGVEDTLNSVPAVRMPDNSFVLDFPGGLLGAMGPGNRQSVSAWVARSNRSVSPYLQEGIRFAESGAEVIMVLDLKNAFSAKEVELGIERFKSVQNSKVDREKLSQLIASVKGLMLGITFRDMPYGKIKIDFGQDATMLSDIAKPLILDILGEYGVMIDEVAEWEPEVKANQVSLGGYLTRDGLTRLASLIQLPTGALHAHAAATQNQSAQSASDTQGQSQKPTVLETTQDYYESVQHLLKNLRSRKGDMRTMGQLAQWFENYGRHVDQLPTLNVDKEMLQYGSYISSQLHGASMMLKGTTINRRIAEMNAAGATSPYGGAIGNVSQNNWQQGSYGWGGGSFGGNYGRYMETNAVYGLAARGGVQGAIRSELRQQQRAVTEVHAQAKASAATSVQQIVQNIQNATTQIRQAMTDKYQVQF
jgi:hypothetical protein